MTGGEQLGVYVVTGHGVQNAASISGWGYLIAYPHDVKNIVKAGTDADTRAASGSGATGRCERGITHPWIAHRAAMSFHV